MRMRLKVIKITVSGVWNCTGTAYWPLTYKEGEDIWVGKKSKLISKELHCIIQLKESSGTLQALGQPELGIRFWSASTSDPEMVARILRRQDRNKHETWRVWNRGFTNSFRICISQAASLSVPDALWFRSQPPLFISIWILWPSPFLDCFLHC